MCKKKHVFLSTGLSVKQIPKTMVKTECWVVRWSKRNEGFTDKKRGGRPKVLNKTAKIVLEGHVQNRKSSEVDLTTVSKLSLKQVHEKQSLETPQMAKKPGAVRQATFSSSQICKEEQKPYCGKGTE